MQEKGKFKLHSLLTVWILLLCEFTLRRVEENVSSFPNRIGKVLEFFPTNGLWLSLKWMNC
jgi:hypothetical protein